jgi:hypothetical protein
MKYTDEELMELASSKVTITDGLDRFISEFGIKNGKHKIEASIFYNAYISWAGKTMSFMSFKDRMKTKLDNNKNVYFTNYRPIELFNTIDKEKITYGKAKK